MSQFSVSLARLQRIFRHAGTDDVDKVVALVEAALRLPLTADGVRCYPGMELWCFEVSRGIPVVYSIGPCDPTAGKMASDADTFEHDLACCYSTEAAAREAADAVAAAYIKEMGENAPGGV